LKPGDGRSCKLGRPADLFPDNAAERFFQWFLGAQDVLAQDFVDDGLIVAATGKFDLVAEPGKDFVIEADGDSCFPLGNGNDSATLCLAEIVFTLQNVPRTE
jgi:hypothetical protein